MSLDTFLNVFKISNIIHWIIEIPSFIIKPSKYIPIFFQKKRDEKALQTIFYYIVALLLEFLFMKEITVTTFLKITILELLLLIPVFITIFTTNFLLRRFSKSKLTNAQIVSFIFIYKSFATILMTLMSFLFIKTEHYIFYLFYNILFISLAVFLSFYSVRIFHDRIRFIVLGFIISYCLFNTQSLVIDKIISYDSFTDNLPILTPQDPIYAEYEQTLQEVTNYVFLVPKARLNLKLNKGKPTNLFIINESYVANRFDALDTILEQGYYYKHDMLIIREQLDTIIPKLKYKRNKAIFSKLARYVKSLEMIYNDRTNDTISVKCFSQYKLAGPNQKEFGQAKFYRLPTHIKNPLDSALIEIENLTSRSSSSELILDYGLLAIYYPYYLLSE